MQRVSFILFIFTLIFSPLAFATVEPWSTAIVEFALLSSALLLFIAAYRKQLSLFQVPGGLPLLLLICWTALQLVPLPPFLLKLLSPAALDMYAPLNTVNTENEWFPLTLNPKATLLALFRWSSLSFCYVLTIQHLKEAKPLKQAVTITVTLGSILAVTTILQKLTSPGTMLWFRPAPAYSYPMGPWVYSNQYAGFMGMIFPLIISLFLYYRPHVSYDRNFKARMLTLLTAPGSNRYLLLGSGAILIAVSILFSLSRGGITTLCIAFLFFTVLWMKVTRSRHLQWGIAISAGVILMTTWFGWQPIMKEFGGLWGENGLDPGSRLPLFRDTLTVFKAFPFAGSGLGTFQYVYPAFRTIPGELVFDHAHNDYLELLADGGLIGFLLAGWFLVSVLRNALTTLYARHEPYSILLTCGALTGILALLLHCLVDFQLASGANALYFFLFLGLAVSGANTRIQYRSSSTLLQPTTGKKPLPILAALILLTSSSWYTVSIFRAEATSSSLAPVYLNPHIPPERLREIHGVFASASSLDPLEADYRVRMGRVSTLLDQREQAREEYLTACRLNPSSGYLLQQLGLSLDNQSQQEQFLALGISREPLDLRRYLDYATWLLRNNRTEDAMDVLRRAMVGIPERSGDIERFMLRSGIPEEKIEQILPDRTSAWHELAKIMESLHRPGNAERYYLRSLDFLEAGGVRPDYFRRPYTFFLRNKEPEKALSILRMGVASLPDDPWFRLQLGDYYLREGILYRASEEYRQGLRIAPDNKELRKRMKELSETDD